MTANESKTPHIKAGSGAECLEVRTRDTVEAIVAEMRELADRTADYGLQGMTGKARLDSIANRLQSAHDAEVGALRAFAQEVMEEWNQGDLDGGSRQDIAEKHGLLAPVTVFAPCGEDCACSEYHDIDDWALGQTCYRETPLLTGRAMEGEDGKAYWPTTPTDGETDWTGYD